MVRKSQEAKRFTIATEISSQQMQGYVIKAQEGLATIVQKLM